MNLREYIVNTYSAEVIELTIESRNGRSVIVPTFKDEKENFLYKLKGQYLPLNDVYTNYIMSRKYATINVTNSEVESFQTLMKLAMQDYSDIITTRRIL